MLNEIGRALSSTLDPEMLFETILTEMKRLFDVDYFKIALHDPVRNEIRFEVEVRDGVVLPKRSRPVGNEYVTEYLMRTRQPLLIRENYVEEMRKLGLDPQLSHQGCFCGSAAFAARAGHWSYGGSEFPRAALWTTATWK